MSVKNILVVGATGRQGKALIAALRPPASDDAGVSSDLASPFHILALTRKTTSPVATQLSLEPHVTVVQGDLGSYQSIRKIFEDAKKNSSGVWGVFVVLAFPGLGANADEEERHGKMTADLSLEFGVSNFIYSSLERGGESYDDSYSLDRLAKVKIERHVRSLGEQGLSWTILRPGFFMENYDGSIGSITVAVLKNGLKADTTVQLVAVEDIGHVAAGVFRDPAFYASKIVVVVGDTLSMKDQEEAYHNATGRSMPAVVNFIAKGLIAINSHTQGLIADIERVHVLRANNEVPENEAMMAAARRAYPGMTSFHAWAAKRIGKPSQRKKDWNKISVARLATGTS